MVAAAIVGGAVIGGVASNRAADKAADAQGRASSDAIAAQEESERRALEMQRPFYEAGYAATAAMMDMAGLDRSRINDGPSGGDFDAMKYLQDNPDVAAHKDWRYDPEGHYFKYGQFEGRSRPTLPGNSPSDLSSYDKYDWKTDPGYEFRLDEGMRAVERSAAARGILGSGGTLRSATRYAQDYASNEYQKVFDRIATIAGRGQSSASQGASTIVNTGANVGNALINAGEARASGYIAQGNAWANFGNQLGTAAGYGMFGGVAGGGSGNFGSSTSVPGTMYGSGGYIYNV